MAKLATGSELQERILKAGDIFPVGGQQCPGCGGHIIGQFIGRAMSQYDDILLSGGSCGFGSLGARAGMEGGGGSIMGMWGAQVTGLFEAMEALGMKKRVVQIAGDGSTVTMGLGTTLHAFTRQYPFTLIIMDNEYFAQSGYHLSGTAPLKANDRAMIKGKREPSDPVPFLVGMSGAKYTATATIGYPEDFLYKLDTALEHQPSYIQVLQPCEAGWRYPTGMTAELTRLAVRTDLYPLFEWVNDEGEVSFRRTVVTERLPITEYTKHQRRFQHLTEADVADMNNFIDKQSETIAKLEKAFGS